MYKEGLAVADRLYLTEIEGIPPHADVFFPEYNDGTWEVETRQERAETDDTPAYAYVDYVRSDRTKRNRNVINKMVGWLFPAYFGYIQQSYL